MNDFFKRNLVWIAILLCVAGIVLSIIGIPAGNPIFFFVGIVLSLPTVGYLIYHVFFYHEKPELNLNPTTTKISTSNITSIVNKRKDVLLKDEISDDDDLEPFYNGYADDEEIAKRLREANDETHHRSKFNIPEIVLPDFDLNQHKTIDQTTAIENTTNEELLRQREEASTAPAFFTTEVPAELIKNETINENISELEKLENTIESNNINNSDKNKSNTNLEKPYTFAIDDFDTLQSMELNEPEMIIERQPVTEITSTPASESVVKPMFEKTIEESVEPEEPSLDDPTFILPTEPIMPRLPKERPTQQPQLTPVDLTNAKVVHINTETAELRKQKIQEKKVLLSQPNLERYFQRYFIETAACFLMDRTIYKDKNGIAPYNKFAVNKDTNLPEYTMSATKGKLYKFCTYLVDAERFITHQYLYNDFVAAIEQGVSLSRISETLHPLYRKKYKKDFVLNLAHREDWDNVMILVYNHYLLSNNNFKDVFTHVPFEIPFAYNDENIVDYLKDPELQERFSEKYSALDEMGIPTFWDALYICFINSIKQKLTIEQMENAIMREYKKIARSLKRIDASRRKVLRKAS